MKTKKLSALPALVFLASLLILFVIGIRTFIVSAYVGSGYLHSVSASVFKDTETAFNEALPTKNLFIDINGYIERATGRRSHGKYVRLDNGALAYVVKEENVAPFAEAVVSLNHFMEDTVKKPFLYVQFPFQIDPDDQQLPPGEEDHSNENTDKFMALIRANGVPTYDYRSYFRRQPDYYSLFYRTDHHWKAETAFTAAGLLLDRLEADDPSFAVDERVRDIDHYRVDHCDNFLGSVGRQFGYGYCGYERLCTIRPTFDLNLSVYDIDGKLLGSGGAENTVLFPEKLTYENHYVCDMYAYYLNGDNDYRRFVNRSDGLNVTQKKLLIVKDSYANALLPCLIYGYAEVTVVDLRILKVPLTQIIQQTDPDLTIIAYNPSSLTQSYSTMFSFFGK